MPRVPFRLVCFRGRGFEAPAIVMYEDGDHVDLIVFVHGAAAEGSPHAVMFPVAHVRRGIAEGTEPRPSWYPIGAESEDRIV